MIYVAKQCPTEVETLAQSPAWSMDTRETPATKATDSIAAWGLPRDLCALANFTRDLCALANFKAFLMHVLPIVTKKQRGHP